MRYHIEEIPPAPGPYASATPGGINAAGAIAGTLEGEFDMTFVHQAGVTQLRNVFELVSGASAINALGDIVGTCMQPRTLDTFRPFQWLNGAAGPVDLMTVLPETAVDGVGADINDSQVVVGTFEVQAAGLKPHPFLYRNATNEVTVLSPPGATYAFGTAINAANQVVGHLWGIAGEGFIFDAVSGEYSALTFDPEAINDGGLIVGNRDPATPVMKQIGDSNVLLPTFGSTFCRAIAVNNAGVIVGAASLGADRPGEDDIVGVLFEDGSIVNLNDRLAFGGPWHVVAATDINDAGIIVGLARREDDPSRRLRGVRLRPTLYRYELNLPELVAKIFGGVAHGGSGFAYINGQFVPVPSNNPEEWYRGWQRTSPQQREALLGLLLGEIAGYLTANNERAELKALAARVVVAAGKSMAQAPMVASKATETGAPARPHDAKLQVLIERRLASRGARRLQR